ncbi:hypothetical protein Zmor_007447 [Zophobas morio]|uniref:Transposable element Tc3 transposase n=1 Tax=Zophobas morio TaxID=2755281 RepID=A0AA38IWQ9_9CUCU|nr:hypothetical protein Zmor_007447 [Zophobas morio]
MVFTPEQDAFILMAHFRSGTRNPDGTWSYSLQSCIDQFTEAFPDANVGYQTFANHKGVLVHRFETKNCICKGKTCGRKTVLTEEVTEDIQHRLEQSPNKSIRKLSAQTGLSVGSCHKALHKVLHMHLYKVSVVHELLPPDFERRINYCQWFNNNLNDDALLDLTFFTDEAWFHLSGYVNSQNYRTWATENPHIFVETSLHPIKVGVWVAISRRRIIGPIFFHDTVNADRYRTNILLPFFEQLHDDECQYGYFQQDGATAHTAGSTLRFLQEVYDDRIISQGLWPPRSPDLTAPDFFLCGHLKNNVFKNRLHTIDELQQAITHEIENITPYTLQRVFDNMKRRVNMCIANEGNHFQHLL